VVEAVADLHETGAGAAPDAAALRARCDETLERVIAERDAFIGRHEETLLRTLKLAA
jgi:hypothetical protein